VLAFPNPLPKRTLRVEEEEDPRNQIIMVVVAVVVEEEIIMVVEVVEEVEEEELAMRPPKPVSLTRFKTVQNNRSNNKLPPPEVRKNRPCNISTNPNWRN
jgi:hypothetical protein